MCFGGGGGSSGTITMPNTGAYDGMLQAQMSAMQSQMNGAAQQKQAQLQLAQQKQQTALRRLEQLLPIDISPAWAACLPEDS